MQTPRKSYKITFTISLVISVLGLGIIGGELYRKSNHKNKVLAEMAFVIDEVQKNPKSTPTYDDEGVQIQSEADVKATTDEWKMNCLTKLVSTDWKTPQRCELLVVGILEDEIDKRDLTFKPHRKFILSGILLLLSPLYILILKNLWQRISRRKK